MSRYFLALLFTFVLSCKVLSQDYQMQISPVVDRNGDKPSATFAIVEDKQGFIWFGTIDGLYRFDGYSYKIFRKTSHGGNSISSNVIWGMAIDANGIIWIATEGGGLDAFDPKNETFKNFHHTGTSKNEISGNSLWSVIVDSKQDIWIGVAGSGVDRINTKTKEITHFNLLFTGEKLEQEQAIRCLLEDNNGLIWAGCNNSGISVIDPKKGLVKRYFHNHDQSDNLTNNMPYDLYLDSKKQIWACTFGGGVLKLDTIDDKFKPAFSNEADISNLSVSIKERVPGEYWIATENGLNIYYSKTKSLKSYRQKGINEEEISENRLRKIYIDSKGIVWIGNESGVEKFVTQNNFISYDNFSYNSTKDVSGIIKSIVSDGNNLWVGYINNGLVRYSLKSKKSKHYKNFSKNSTKGDVGNINAILIDSKSNLWVSDWNSGLLKYNKENDNFDNISHAFFDTNRLLDNRIQRIIEGRQGILWIGTEGGLNRYDIEKDEFKSYKHQDEDNNSLSSNAIQSQAMVFDKDSNLWIGTWSFGLNKMEFTDSERIDANFKHWKHLPDDSNSLPSNNVISLLYDTTVLWIGTFGQGLCKFDLDSEKFTNYTIEDGLPNNVIFAIMKDKNGNLWLSTDKGISMYDPIKDFFYNYTQEDGLQDNHFFWGAAFKDADGAIYFGGIRGINKFIPELVQPDTATSKPVIVDIKLFNNSLDNQRYNLLSDKLSLYYYENFITIEFAARDYSEPKNNKYKYKLDGFDKDWISNNNINYASYSNLSPGEYTFMLQAATSNGVWSDETVSLKIRVIPPWWKTRIAITLFVVILFGLAFGTHLVRINILKKQKRKLENQVGERTLEISQKNSELKERYEETVAQEEEIREQAEELRTLSEKLKGTNKLLAQKVKERTNELEKALYKAEDAQKLISSFLSNLSHEIRTPLNAIMGFSQLITSHDINLATRDHYADIIEQNVNNLLVQIENIMDIAKLHTGQYQIKNTEFLLNDILAATFNEFKNSREYSHKNFSFKLKSGIILKLFSDPAIFKNIIYNLVENAYKYTEKGTVEIGFRINLPENKNAKTYLLSKNTNIKLEIFVTDTGIGIPEKEQKIIFDAFRKVEHNNQKIYRGSGIGLALVKNLTEKLNGKIILQSEVDKGTSVILEFQLAEI